MLARILIVVTLVAVLAVPFMLRPTKLGGGGKHETVVIITPANDAIRTEFGRGFERWYLKKTGHSVQVDWRVIGGTSEITRFLEGAYVASFEQYWTHQLRRAWSLDVQAGFANGQLTSGANAAARDARAAFLTSNVSCGIDVFFGGGPNDFIQQARTGHLVDSGIRRLHPDWFREETIPEKFAGESYWDADGLWIGCVLSSYGLLYNNDAIRRIGVERPLQWTDLENPKYFGQIALADPTKSGSIAKVFENIIQQQMQRRWTALRQTSPGLDDATLEKRAVREGWTEGLKVLQLIGANARYFTDTSQKPPIDVAQGDSAVGLCIDFYGRQQSEAVLRRAGSSRVEYVSPVGGAVSSVDPIALLRGAPNPEIGQAFIEFVLSMEGQKLWNFRPGTPGGPTDFALRRLPVRRDFYGHDEFRPFLSDPTDRPYSIEAERLIYRPSRTGDLFREMSFIIRAMCIDTHQELAAAWKGVSLAGQPADALATLQDMENVSYDETAGRIKTILNAKDKSGEIRLSRELADSFRKQYAKAEHQAQP